ncbi:mechanosensitive ion channel family protein [Methylophilus flavus]|jgi:small-conductance mechanosensitive channel|uniref:Mechanosensitive ion channel family protein n=1 Tax=Methylophilus flavus TaxID=640084 RepID=A0ABW3PAX6_9PROT
MSSWLQYKFLSFTINEWLYTLLIFMCTYLALLIVWKFSIKRISRFNLKNPTKLGDLITEVMRSTNQFTFALFSLLFAMHFLELNTKWVTRLDYLSFLIIGIQIAVWLSKGISLWAKAKVVATDGSAENAVLTTMLSWIFKTIVWSIAMLSILANMGVNITAFVASLGVGGVAVALAVQNILSDLFASLAIGLDKPFVIGDFIIFGSVLGTVERVGLKTTHIRSLSGEQIVCGNTELLKNTIHNYKRMAERRVVFEFRVTYDTKADIVEKIPVIVKNAITAESKARFDRAHFKGFGLSSLDFEVVYYVLDSSYNVYMDTQQSINLYLMRELESMKVNFAFPTMTLDLSKNPHLNMLFPESAISNSLQ